MTAVDGVLPNGAAGGFPLEGIKVLDLSRVFAGPIAGRMLSDLGADVVKIEPPEGDVTRTYDSPPRDEPYTRQTSYFSQQNAGKRSVVVDLMTDDGVALVKRLAAEADIVLENFRPGIMARFGLDWAALSAEHPDLIMLSISGFGQEGPESGRAAYAGVIHAETGVLARRFALDPNSGVDLEISVADSVSGLHGVIAVLAALRMRDQTGLGQHIDMAMVDAMLTVDDFAHRPLGRSSQIYDVVGGPIIVLGDFKWMWYTASRRLGLPDPAPEGCDLATKIRTRREAWVEFVHSFDDRADLIAALDKANLAWGDVKPTDEAMQSPTVDHRESILDVSDGEGGTVRLVQSPYRFSNAKSEIRGAAPREGEHRDEVLRDWLGER